MLKILGDKVGPWTPLMFGIGFIAPVLREILLRAGVDALPALIAGLLVGGLSGLWASKRGRIWLGKGLS